MRNIIIVECISTGYNLVEDIIQRGYNPIILEPRNTSGEYNSHRAIYDSLKHHPVVLQELDDYDKTLQMVKGYAPVLIVPGNEAGVPLSVMLSEDLGLPGNPKSILPQMVRKNKMHEALKEAGLRYIRGQVVKSPEEAEEFCKSLNITSAVVKPIQSAGSNGLFLCDSIDDVRNAVTEIFTMIDYYGRKVTEALIQERIVGTEYIVNTTSCDGLHRLNSILRYKKHRTREGGYIYDYAETISQLEPGHAAMVEYAFKVADAIGIRYGLVHGEYMIDEHGPILIEVNCRPMGGTMPAQFLDRIFGQHETDSLLDCYLYPEKFKEDRLKPYKTYSKGVLKFIIVPRETEVENHPLWEVGKQLRSTCKIAAGKEVGPVYYHKTRDLETSGGIIYLNHKDESVVMSDLNLLQQIETKYFQLLLNDGMSRRWLRDEVNPDVPFEQIMSDYGCKGSILIASDEIPEINGVCAVTPETLYDETEGFDYVIIGYQNCLMSLDETKCLKLMFDTMNLVRPGGTVLIPKNTWKYLSYNREGAEQMLVIKGFSIQPLISTQHDMVVGKNGCL